MLRVRRNTFSEFADVLLALFLGEEWSIENKTETQQNIFTERFHRLLWKSCDGLVRIATRIKPLKRGQTHLFCVTQHRYLGRPLTVDEVLVRRFDPIIEIHMDNKVLAEMIQNSRSLVSLATSLIKETKRALPALADCVVSQKYDRAKILYSTTCIHRGVERFGFSTYPIQNQAAHRFLAWYLRNIFRMVNPDACALFDSHSETFSPKIVAMSKYRLMQRYGETCKEESEYIKVDFSSH